MKEFVHADVHHLHEHLYAMVVSESELSHLKEACSLCPRIAGPAYFLRDRNG